MTNRILICFFFIAVCASGSICGDQAISREPQGKMIVAVERIGEEYFIKSVTVVPGAETPPADEGDTLYTIFSGDGGILAEGRTTIHRWVYSDRVLPGGDFTGERRRVEETVIALPYYLDAARLEFRSAANKQILLSEEIGGAMTAIPQPLSEPDLLSSSPADYAGYLQSFRWESPITTGSGVVTFEDKAASPPAKKIPIDVEVKGAPEGLVYWLNVSFCDKDSAVEQYYFYGVSGEMTASVPAGQYIIYATCDYPDPTIGYKTVRLHPRPLIVAFNTNEKKLILPFKFNNLVIGEVELEGGGKVSAYLEVLDPKADRYYRSEVLTQGFDCDNQGRFYIRLPKGSYPMIVIPSVKDGKAGSLLKVVQVKRKGVTEVKFTLPKLGPSSGAALKQIWGGDNGPCDSPQENSSGKLNIILLAEGYSGGLESFTDKNGNGIWDGDLVLDVNGNGRRDVGEYYYDRNHNGKYDAPEPFVDANGDGICNRYERAKFEIDSALAAAYLLNLSPFNVLSNRINIYTYWMPSQHGVTRFTNMSPWKNMNTALESYSTGTTPNSSLAVNESKLHNAAASALPDYTVPVVMVHDPLYALISDSFIGNFGRVVISTEDIRHGAVLAHELGHSIGGLQDEYVQNCNKGKYYPDEEDPAPNLTTVDDPNKVKWKNLIKGDPPVPTPYWYGGYGLFEGPLYSYGIYRPTAISMMRAAGYPFYKVNSNRLKAVIKKFK
jgi:hypothetical protein